MNKRTWHHVWTKLRKVKVRYLLAITLVCGVVCVLALRSNYQHMVSLRDAVYSADKNDGNVQGALQNLQQYVTAHMNTDLSTGNTAVYPPIQLQYTYQRLVEAQGAQLQAANSGLYTAAQAYCQAQDPVDFSGHNRVPCIEQYVTQHGEQPLPTIPDSLYQFDFVSPRWSPDLAGWSLLLTIVLGIITLLLFVANRIFKRTT